MLSFALHATVVMTDILLSPVGLIITTSVSVMGFAHALTQQNDTPTKKQKAEAARLKRMAAEAKRIEGKFTPEKARVIHQEKMQHKTYLYHQRVEISLQQEYMRHKEKQRQEAIKQRDLESLKHYQQILKGPFHLNDVQKNFCQVEVEKLLKRYPQKTNATITLAPPKKRPDKIAALNKQLSTLQHNRHCLYQHTKKRTPTKQTNTPSLSLRY